MTALDRIRDGFYTLDREWRFLVINRAAEQYIGRPREELLGKVFWEEFPQLLGTQLEAEYRRAMVTQEDREFELRSPVYRRWVEVRVFPSPDGLSVSFLDATARKHAQDALRASEAEYRALFEYSVDGILLTSPTGDILDANPAARRMLGRSTEEIVACGRAGIVAPDDPRLPALVEQRQRDGHARGELTFVRKDGTRFPVEVASAVFTDENGNSRTSLSFRDLTAAKRGEAGLRLLADASAALTASLDVEAVVHDLAGIIVPAIADVVVIDLADGSTWRRDVTEDGVRRIAGDAAEPAASRARGSSSHLTVPMLARGTSLGTLTLAQLDPDRRFDVDLPLVQGLADRAALALDNARLYADAVAARKLRDEMLGVVSHDLKTPLNAIALQAQLLARRYPAIDLAPIRDSVHHADRLVQELLTITAIESGRLPLRLQDEDPCAMLEEVVDLHRSIARERELSLSCRCAPDLGPVHLDRQRIVQAVANLVGNAIKFTPPGGAIELRARRGPAGTILEVSDTGAGIPPDQIQHVFDRFWQGRHREEGVGLGLAIARGVIEAHGGAMTVTSQVGVGTTFTASLPDRE